MDYVKGGVTVQTGTPQEVIIPSKRLRVTMWTDHPGMVLGDLNMKTGALSRAPDRVASRKGKLDDISLISTLEFDYGNGVRWRTPSGTESFFVSMCRDAIELCHSNGIQLIAGYALGDHGSTAGPRGQAFLQWLRSPTSPSIAEYADQVIELLLDKEGTDFDGLGFDIELVGMKDSDAGPITELYQGLADRLAARGKLLAIATGIAHNKDMKLTLPQFRAQPFSIARGKPNIIIRPMAYDNWVLNDAGMWKWHEDIIDYALNDVGLTPGQLQLGVKTTANDTSVLELVKKAQPGISDAEARWVCCYKIDECVERCEKMLRPKEVGFVNFAGWLDFARIDAALNPDGPPSNTPGDPVQVPLSAPVA